MPRTPTPYGPPVTAMLRYYIPLRRTNPSVFETLARVRRVLPDLPVPKDVRVAASCVDLSVRPAALANLDVLSVFNAAQQLDLVRIKCSAGAGTRAQRIMDRLDAPRRNAAAAHARRFG